MRRGERTPRSAATASWGWRSTGVAPQVLEVAAPGLYELAEHPRHERHELTLRASPGLDLYSVSFSAGVP